jgi:hypothetical protein
MSGETIADEQIGKARHCPDKGILVESGVFVQPCPPAFELDFLESWHPGSQCWPYNTYILYISNEIISVIIM